MNDPTPESLLERYLKSNPGPDELINAIKDLPWPFVEPLLDKFLELQPDDSDLYHALEFFVFTSEKGQRVWNVMLYRPAAPRYFLEMCCPNMYFGILVRLDAWRIVQELGRLAFDDGALTAAIRAVQFEKDDLSREIKIALGRWVALKNPGADVLHALRQNVPELSDELLKQERVAKTRNVMLRQLIDSTQITEKETS